MADAGEVATIIIVGIIALAILSVVGNSYDDATDPSTDPHSGDQFDDGVKMGNYSADHPVKSAQSHQDVDLGPSSNPQVEAG